MNYKIDDLIEEHFYNLEVEKTFLRITPRPEIIKEKTNNFDNPQPTLNF